MASPAPAKFRIDVDIHSLLINSAFSGPKPAEVQGRNTARTCFPAVSGTAQRSRPGNPTRKARLDP